MPNNGYRFSEGFTVYREKVIKGGRKIADFKNSKWINYGMDRKRGNVNGK